MYSTCLFCSGALGRNESIEHFPVGRRLAFDAAKGRLWVICPTCARWNLSPLESRWEAIDEAERAYRDTKLRSATEHIGLARLNEGTELVRIGRPLLPEFAAWRYGGVFKTRHRKELAWHVGLAGAQLLGAGISFSDYSGFASVGLVSLSNLAQFANLSRSMYRSRVPVLTVRTHEGALLRLSANDAAQSHVMLNEVGRWSLRVDHRSRATTGPILQALGVRSRPSMHSDYSDIEDDAAIRALATMLPMVNQAGGNRKLVDSAVTLMTRRQPGIGLLMPTISQSRSIRSQQRLQLGFVDPTVRLALEMTLHEDDERRALDGELAALEARWREAEEIAGISDNLLLPSEIDAELERLRRGKR